MLRTTEAISVSVMRVVMHEKVRRNDFVPPVGELFLRIFSHAESSSNVTRTRARSIQDNDLLFVPLALPLLKQTFRCGDFRRYRLVVSAQSERWRGVHDGERYVVKCWVAVATVGFKDCSRDKREPLGFTAGGGRHLISFHREVSA
jgi:hypothetical protein